MKCQWELIDGLYQCKNCGSTISDPKIKQMCVIKDKAINLDNLVPELKAVYDAIPKPEPEPPNLLQRGINFVKAGANHIRKGLKHCTLEQRTERLNTCQSNQCGLFKKFDENSPNGVCAHDDCGCFIRSNGKFMDKLSWADSKCPVGLWGPIEVKTPENSENGV